MVIKLKLKGFLLYFGKFYLGYEQNTKHWILTNIRPTHFTTAVPKTRILILFYRIKHTPY